MNTPRPSRRGRAPPANGASNRLASTPTTIAVPMSKNTRGNGYRIDHQPVASTTTSISTPIRMTSSFVCLASSTTLNFHVMNREMALTTKIVNASRPTRTHLRCSTRITSVIAVEAMLWHPLQSVNLQRPRRLPRAAFDPARAGDAGLATAGAGAVVAVAGLTAFSGAAVGVLIDGAGPGRG